MAYTAYICRVRTDIPDGAIQITDLSPNTSQKSAVYEPGLGQTGYLGPYSQNDTLAALVANATVAEYQGLAAYLIDHVQDAVSGVTITVAVANAAAVGIIAIKDAGGSLALAAVNAALVAGGAGAGTTLTSSGGNASLTDILKILSGAVYTLPAGSVVGGLALPASLGSFDLSTYRQIYVTGALQISCVEGTLAGYASSTFNYSETTGAALVVYDYQGTVLT